MDFSYHSHNFEFRKAGGETWLEIFYDKADPRYVKAGLDTYWVQAGGGCPAAWIRELAGRMPVLHVKDMVVGRPVCAWRRSARATWTGPPSSPPPGTPA